MPFIPIDVFHEAVLEANNSDKTVWNWRKVGGDLEDSNFVFARANPYFFLACLVYELLQAVFLVMC